MGNTRKAKWTKWQRIPNVKLWQAVALSLGIDPNAVKHNEMIIDESPFDEGEEFDERLEILKANYWDRNLFSANDLVMGKINECKVSLSEFAVFALSIPWTVPQELADLAQNQKSEPEGGNTVNGETSRNDFSLPGADSEPNAKKKLIEEIQNILSNMKHGSKPESIREIVELILDYASSYDEGLDRNSIPGRYEDLYKCVNDLLGKERVLKISKITFRDYVKGNIRKSQADPLCKCTGNGQAIWSTIFPDTQ